MKKIEMSKKNKFGLIILNSLLFTGIIVGQYELLDLKSVIYIFIVPAFIISASLFPLMKNYSSKKKLRN